MNLALLDPFKSSKPVEHMEKQIKCFEMPGGATCCKFNRHGSYLAVGCSTGQCAIVDFTTQSVVKTIVAHVRAISSLSWNKKGSRLATSSIDGSVAIWDMTSCKEIAHIDFDGSVISSVEFVPKHKYDTSIFVSFFSSILPSEQILVCFIGQSPKLVEVLSGDSVDLLGKLTDESLHVEVSVCTD